MYFSGLMGRLGGGPVGGVIGGVTTREGAGPLDKDMESMEMKSGMGPEVDAEESLTIPCHSGGVAMVGGSTCCVAFTDPGGVWTGGSSCSGTAGIAVLVGEAKKLVKLIVGTWA